MKVHQVFQNEDEILSQNVGISFAVELFNDFQDITQQSVSFSWGTFGDTEIRIAVSSLALYFKEIPSNLIDLKKITALSFLTECEILVEKAGSTIPIAHYDMDEIRNHLIKKFNGFYDQLKSRFKRDFNRNNISAESDDWQVAFTELHTPLYVYNNAVDYLDRYSSTKGLEIDEIQMLQVDFRKYLRKLFLGEE